MGLKFALEAVDLLAVHFELLHYVHPVPLVLTLFLLRLRLQLFLPCYLELLCTLEVIQSGGNRVFERGVMRIRSRSDLFEKLLEGLHEFGLMFGGMGKEMLFIKEAHISQIQEQFLPCFEPSLISGWIQPIKVQDLSHVVTHQELKLNMFVIGTANKSILVQLHPPGWQEKSKESSETAIRLIESASQELLGIGCHVKIYLFLVEYRIGSHVVILNEMPLIDLQQHTQILQAASLLQHQQEIDIPMDLFFRQWDIWLHFNADGCDDVHHFGRDLSVFSRSKGFGVLKGVSSHDGL